MSKPLLCLKLSSNLRDRISMQSNAHDEKENASPWRLSALPERTENRAETIPIFAECSTTPTAKSTDRFKGWSRKWMDGVLACKPNLAESDGAQDYSTFCSDNAGLMLSLYCSDGIFGTKSVVQARIQLGSSVSFPAANDASDLISPSSYVTSSRF